MKQRTIALLLAAVLTVTALGATVLAAEENGSGSLAAPAQEGREAAAPEEDRSAFRTADGPDAQDSQEGEEPEDEPEPVEEYIPDPVGSITFANLEHRLRESNLNVMTLEENIQAVQSIDYDKMKEDLRKGLNQIARAQWMMIEFGQGDSYAYTAMANSYSSMRNTFEDLKDGVLQEDNAALVRQLENAQEQVVMAGETLYIALLDMERSDQGLKRSLAALDRTLTELELRYQLGHISSQTLEQARAGRTALVSGQQTLRSNITTYKMQLELLIGAELTGTIQLGALPQVTRAQLNKMDLEQDLEAAKEASYSLFAAKRTLDDAQKDYKDAGRQYNYNEKRYEYQSAMHQWQAAQYTYSSAVQNFEMAFRTLYLQVKDNKQVLDAAKTALAVEKNNCSVAQLKYSQGNLSKNALLDAEDKVSEAQETVDGAAIDLFTAYHNYRWAVDYGILN